MQTGDDQKRAYDLMSRDHELRIIIRKEFDFGTLHQGWAQRIIAEKPGPFTAVILDLSRVGQVSSTFFAGMLQLLQFYLRDTTGQLILFMPDPRVVRNLQIMRLQDLVHIVPR